MDNETSVKPLWGPWSPDLNDAAERTAQLRCLAGLVRVITKGNVSLVRMLRLAEDRMHRDPAEWPGYNKELQEARRLFDALPTLEQRQIIATFASVNAPLDSKQMMAPDPPPRISLTVSEVMEQYTGGLGPVSIKIEGEPYCEDIDPFPYE